MRHLFEFLAIFTIGLSSCYTSETFDTLMQQKTFKVEITNNNLFALHDASTLLISCVDFRLRSETEIFMNTQLKLLAQYDEIAIPGASLAVVTTEFPCWEKTLDEVIAILITLHNIERIILLDHTQCGAYKLIFGAQHLKTGEQEVEMHTKVMREAKKTINREFPNLKVYALLMGLDGTIENLTSTL